MTGQLFQAIQGTSMSSPHAAGVSALVKAAHPDWTPGQIKSALMTSSIQAVLKEDGATPADPFDRGAGSIRANRAISPTITFDVAADDYYASASDELGRVDLNLPSIYANPMPGAFTTERTFTNVSGQAQTFAVGVEADSNVTISVKPSSFSLVSGATQKIKVTINAAQAAEGMHFGQITLDASAGNDAVLPVAFNRTQGAIGLDHTCDPTTLGIGDSADCEVTVTNLAPVPARAELTVTGPKDRAVQITGISAPGRTSGPNGLAWKGTLSPALAPTIDSIEDAGRQSPGGGYLPLSLFGIGPIGGMSDEAIVNFDVPPFRYGSEVYERIAVDSNGYVVVGGGSAEDNDCCAPQDFPDPTRPNNVLAPYWTDLNPGTGGAVRIGILTDGVTDWLIVDWDQVDTFGVATSASSFQVWIQLGETEGLWFAYGALSAPSPDGLTVGAENRDGDSGVTLAGPPTAADYVITTSPPAPGGHVTITYDALARVAGEHVLSAAATSNVTRATTIEEVNITVE